MTAKALLLIALLVLFGNAKSYWDLVILGSTAAGSLFGIGAGIALTLTILLGTVARRVDSGKLGLVGGTVKRSVQLALQYAGAASLVAAVLIVGGSLVARAFDLQLATVTPAATIPWDQLLWRALLLLWVDTAIPEELAFRGALLLVLTSHKILISSAVFALWHVVVVIQDGQHDLLTVLSKLFVIGVGGVLFGVLRQKSGNLLAPIVGHWLFDAVAMLAARFAVVL